MDRTKERVDLFIPDDWKEKSLREAREYVDDHKDTGAPCPCCGQLCKAYYRKFNRNMARFLISLSSVAASEKKWVHYSSCEFSGRDYAAITYWGLAAIKKSDGETKRSSGYWLPTRKGIDFINGAIEIPSHVIIFNNKIEWSRGGFSSTHINIEEALGEDFSYDELMGARKIVQSWNVLNEEPRTVTELLKKKEVTHAENIRPSTPPTPIQGA